ncbi:MAG: NAD-dependent epimerase/dehydratase family protein [Sphingobacteriia bacterium]|jgi:nucleoside-diphosphate-sugar epimerase
MKVCITGGAGMIGSTLLKKLIDLGNEVVVIDNFWRGKKENIDSIPGWDYSNYFFNIDIAEANNEHQLIDVIKSCDVVIHLADIVAGIGYVFNNQYEIFKINNQINTNLFNACAKAGVKKILYAGTACSFPKDLQMSLTAVLKEEQLFPAEPESAYGWSKLIGTLELQYMAEKYNIDITTLMLHNVYGANCDIDPKRSQVIPSIIRKMIELKEGETLQVWGSGNQGRAFIHVDDIANAFALALSKSNLPQIIQIGPSYCTSIKELVLTLKDKVLKKDIEIFYDKSKPEGDIGRSADYTIAKNVLGWEPLINLEKGLLLTTNWIQEKLKNN